MTRSNLIIQSSYVLHSCFMSDTFKVSDTLKCLTLIPVGASVFASIKQAASLRSQSYKRMSANSRSSRRGGAAASFGPAGAESGSAAARLPKRRPVSPSTAETRTPPITSNIRKARKVKPMKRKYPDVQLLEQDVTAFVP